MKYFIVILLSITALTGCNNTTYTPEETPYDKLTDALLNKRLQIEVVKEEGASNPCEPQEPYFRLSTKELKNEAYIKESSTERDIIDFRETWVESDIADGIVLLESTGEVEIMGTCLE